MAEAVVHHLEPVDVGEEDDHARGLAAQAGQGQRQAVEEQGSVGQLGERVVQGLMSQALVGPFALDHRAQLAGNGGDQFEHPPVVAALARVEQLEHGDHLALGQDGHSDADQEPGLARQAVVRGVRHQQRLPRRPGPPGQTGTGR